MFRSDAWNDVEPKVDPSAQQRLAERRALAAKVRAMAAEKAELKRGSAEFNALHKKHQQLMQRIRELAPAK